MGSRIHRDLHNSPEGIRRSDFPTRSFAALSRGAIPSIWISSMTPLDGMPVLDFTRVLSGPSCTMQLGDLGARVIKIEQPGRGDDTRAWGPPFIGGESAYFLSINRNKESLALDLKQPRAKAIV